MGFATSMLVVLCLTIAKAVQVTGVITVPGLSMLSRGQEYHVTAGGQLVLDCEFHMESFDYFDNPTIWVKSQREERTTVNVMSIIQEPFGFTGRFDVTLNSQPPRYRLVLKIKDLAQMDSGNYTCEVRKQRSVVLDRVTHSVYVLTQVASVRFTPVESSSSSSSRGRADVLESGHGGLLNATSGDSVPIRCVVVGGFPDPAVDVFLGTRNVTDRFPFVRRDYNVTGARGLRLIDVLTARWTPAFLMQPNHDGLTLQCSARVHGMDPVGDHLRLNIVYRPLISCSSKYIPLDEVHACVRCTINSRPEPMSVYWSLNNTVEAAIAAVGTTPSPSPSQSQSLDGRNDHGADGKEDVRDDKSNGGNRNDNVGYWSSIRDLGNGVLESSLCMQRTGEEATRIYTIVAENSVGQVFKNVQLFMEYKTFGDSVAESEELRPMRTADFKETATRRTDQINIGSFLDHHLHPPKNTRDVLPSSPSSSSSSSASGFNVREASSSSSSSSSVGFRLRLLPATTSLISTSLLLFSWTCASCLHSIATTTTTTTMTTAKPLQTIMMTTTTTTTTTTKTVATTTDQYTDDRSSTERNRLQTT